MTQNDEFISELQAYLVLLVQEAGGTVNIPYEIVEAGVPNGTGIRIIPDEKGQQLTFKIATREELDA